MTTLLEKVRRSYRYYYYSQKNNWHFPSNIAHLSGGQMACGSYEPAVSQEIIRNLEEGSTFLDVGANVGYFSRLASEVVGSHGAVYAFEVDYENYFALSKNVMNHPNIFALHFAISDRNSFTNLNCSSHSACHSLVDTDNLLDGGQYTVPTITLDHFWKTYLNSEPIRLLKVDVEGAEPMVLNGMDTLLEQNMIETIIIEFCPAIIKNAGFGITDFYNKLTPHFALSVIDEEGNPLSGRASIRSAADLKKISGHLLNDGIAVNINLIGQSQNNT